MSLEKQVRDADVNHQAGDAVGNGKAVAIPVQASADIFALVQNQFLGGMREIHKLAEEPGKFLMAIGGALMVAVLATNVEIEGSGPLATYSSTEFIAALGFGTVLVILGGLAFVFQWHKMNQYDVRLTAMSSQGMDRAFELASQSLTQQTKHADDLLEHVEDVRKEGFPG